jgi:hypothetical protein
VYLASPDNRLQAEAVAGMPVLLSFALAKGKVWMEREYVPTFDRVLIDSGAFSELNTGKKVDLGLYAEWSNRWVGHADAIAGLDDISGDWRRSLANYEAMPDGLGFPTFHDTDPPELLDDLIPIARERGGWIGLGLKPPRESKERWVRAACDRIPDGLHVHGWALRRYTHVRRLDSVDSNNWWKDAMKIRTQYLMDHLTYGECLEIMVKRYQRWQRVIRAGEDLDAMPLFKGGTGTEDQPENN